MQEENQFKHKDEEITLANRRTFFSKHATSVEDQPLRRLLVQAGTAAHTFVFL